MNSVLQVFNSSVLSGPEKLVLDNMHACNVFPEVLFLEETRVAVRGIAPWQYAEELGFPVRRCAVRSRVDRKAIDELRRMLSEFSTVHAHDVKASSYVLAASRGVRGGPRPFLVSTHHGVRGRSGFRARLYEQWYARWVLPRFDRVLCVCSSDKALLLRRGTSRERLFVHLNGVAAPALRTRDQAFRELSQLTGKEVSASEQVLRLFYVGRLEPEKNVAAVIEFFDNFLRFTQGAQRHAELFIFGDGRERNSLEREVQRRGIGAHCFFFGHTSAASTYLSVADTVVLLSPAEGLPLTLLEAAASGVPICARAVDGVQDLLPDERFGTLTSGSEPLAQLAIRHFKRLESGAAALAATAMERRYNQQFTAEAWCEALSHFLNPSENEINDVLAVP